METYIAYIPKDLIKLCESYLIDYELKAFVNY